jgi:replicative DNA helicase
MNAHAYDLSREDHSRHFGQQGPAVPESMEAEQALLGAILVRGEALEAVPPTFDASHFYEPIHQELYGAILKAAEAKKNINPITVRSFLSPEVAARAVGTMTVSQYLARLASEAVSIVNVPEFADAITGSYLRRAGLSASDEFSRACYHANDDLEYLEQARGYRDRLNTIIQEAEARDDAYTVSPGEAYISRMAAASENNGSVGVAISLGEISKVLNSTVFEAGNLYGLLSSSGEGKTSLTMQLMYSAFTHGHPVLFLSYDQSPAQCVAQLIAQARGIDTKQQSDPNGKMRESERDQCADFAIWLNSQPFEIIRCQREGNSRLLSYAHRFVRKHRGGKTPFIVIDHIKKIKPHDERASPDKISSAITVEWKAFADETASSVLMLNQRNTEGTRRLNPRPIGRDIYGGEGAKEDYDAMLYLYRPAKYKKDMVATAASDRDRNSINAVFNEFGDEDQIETVAEIGAIKVRFGDPSIRERLKFNGRYTKYESIVRDYDNGRLI